MAVEIKVKQWGNSLGCIFPKEFVKANNLKEDSSIIIEIVKKADLTNVFGTVKMKMSGQEFKDMVRKGWN